MPADPTVAAITRAASRRPPPPTVRVDDALRRLDDRDSYLTAALQRAHPLTG